MLANSAPFVRNSSATPRRARRRVGSTRDEERIWTTVHLMRTIVHMTADSVSRPSRRHDPDRRERIIDSCLDVIAEHGVAGTSHRRVAAAASVPLGSMTYHFTGMDELLREAFGRFAREIASTFERRLSAASSPTDARKAV